MMLCVFFPFQTKPTSVKYLQYTHVYFLELKMEKYFCRIQMRTFGICFGVLKTANLMKMLYCGDRRLHYVNFVFIERHL